MASRNNLNFMFLACVVRSVQSHPCHSTGVKSACSVTRPHVVVVIATLPCVVRVARSLGGVQWPVTGCGCSWRVAATSWALCRAAHLCTAGTCVLDMFGVASKRLPRLNHRPTVDTRRAHMMGLCGRRASHFLKDIIAAQLRRLMVQPTRSA